MSETIDQFFADSKRIIDMGLSEDDYEIVLIGYNKLAGEFGSDFAEGVLMKYISYKIGMEEFSFEETPVTQG